MNKNKKDKKRYYCKNMNMKNKRHEELAGNNILLNINNILETISGVLITTDKNKEKHCVKDTYNILNDAVEFLYPDFMKKLNETKEEEQSKSKTENKTGENQEIIKSTKKQKLDENSSKNTNISDLLEDELQSLRKNKTKLFFNFETNCKGVIFVKLEKLFKTDLDIKRISKYIIDKVRDSKEQISRNISRFVPVEVAFKAKLDLFKKNAPLILDKYFIKPSDIKDENQIPPKTSWKLEFKSRNNTSINKTEFLEFLLDYIDKTHYYVDYKNPQLIVLIEITNDLLCLSVLEDYYENKCYNLMTLSKSEEELKNERDKLMKMQLEKEIEKKRMKQNEITQEDITGENNIKNYDGNEDNQVYSGEVHEDKEVNDNRTEDNCEDEEDDIRLI